MFKQARIFILVGTLLALLGSLSSVYKRWQVEKANRAVTLAVESDVVATLAAGSHISVDQAMSRLNASGFRGLVVSEQSIAETIAEDRAAIRYTGLDTGTGGTASLIVNDPSLRERLLTGLQVRFGDLMPAQSDSGPILLPPTDVGLLRGTSIFLDPAQIAPAKAQKWSVIARASNPSSISNEGVGETLNLLKREGADVFLPQGDTVLGRRDGRATAVDTMKATGLLYASPEFTKLGGDVEMLQALPEQVVRLHSAQSAELDKLSPAAAVERYTKAAGERGMRILLLRPMGAGSADPLGAFCDFGSQIVKGMKKDGLEVGIAHPYTDPNPTMGSRAMIGIGIAAVTIGTALAIGLSGIPLAFAGLAAIAAIGAGATGKATEQAALLATLVFPIAGFLLAFGFGPRDSKGARPLPTPLALIAVTVVSLVGGLCVAGLLNSIPYLIRAETFSGVKLAVFLPVVVIGALAFAKLADFRSALAASITWGTAGLAFLVVAILGIMIIRSGNDAPAGVSGGELAFRGLLEAILPVRPRTKEFLIGFPALLIGFAWLNSIGVEKARETGRGGWIALLLLLGGIALTDVVNTFCHIHTPLTVSGLRVLLGFAFGCIIGGIGWILVRPVIKRYSGQPISDQPI